MKSKEPHGTAVPLSLSLSLEVLLETGGIRPFREFGVLSLSLANTDNTDRWLD